MLCFYFEVSLPWAFHSKNPFHLAEKTFECVRKESSGFWCISLTEKLLFVQVCRLSLLAFLLLSCSVGENALLSWGRMCLLELRLLMESFKDWRLGSRCTWIRFHPSNHPAQRWIKLQFNSISVTLEIVIWVFEKQKSCLYCKDGTEATVNRCLK